MIDGILMVIGMVLFCLWFFAGAEIVADILLEKFFGVNPNRPKHLYNGLSGAGMVVAWVPVIIYCLIFHREGLFYYFSTIFKAILSIFQ